VPLLINEEGSTGWISVDGEVYNLLLENNSLRLTTHPDIVGNFQICYIKGDKI